MTRLKIVLRAMGIRVKAGLLTWPDKAQWRYTLVVLLIYSIAALGLGWLGGLFDVALLEAPAAVYMVLPLSLLIFPSLLEEAFFRGVLIPLETARRSRRHQLGLVMLSSLIFMLWHPANALTINPGAAPLFTNGYFLAIVFALGVACGLVYLRSGSLWSAILIHWSTVVIWVFWLGGRNLVLQVS